MCEEYTYAKQIIDNIPNMGEGNKLRTLSLWKYIYENEEVDLRDKQKLLEAGVYIKRLNKRVHILKHYKLIKSRDRVASIIPKKERDDIKTWYPPKRKRGTRKKPIAQSPARGYVQRRNGVIIKERFDDKTSSI